MVPHKDFVEVMHRDFVVRHPRKDSVEKVCKEPVVPRRGFLTIRRTHVRVEVCLAVDFQKMGLVPDWDLVAITCSP